MTSGNFRSTPISSIIVNRGDRQRRELTGIAELAESIHRVGLINPLVITEEGLLVAGERRLSACQSLGWTAVTTQYVTDLSDYELQVIELEENVKRVDLDWRDKCAAIARFHALKVENEDGWTQAQTAQALGHDDAAITRNLMVAAAISNPRVAEQQTFNAAHNLVARDADRKRTSTLATVSAFAPLPGDALLSDLADQTLEIIRKQVPMICADFHEWAKEYDGEPFNLIHCDFPYGINVASGPRQHSAIQEHYDDTPDIYWELISTLSDGMSNIVAPSAHMIFWFSMHFYKSTWEALDDMGWSVSPFPLVWHKSDNAGVAPDPQRQPRRTYETAFFCTRGDRKLTQAGAKANSFSWPGGQKEIHLSEKPVAMLQHFLALCCDEYSTVLDPTCGSGNALKAATVLGANSVLGIERSEAFYQTAVNHYWGGEDVETDT